jgi:hypothetical protein
MAIQEEYIPVRSARYKGAWPQRPYGRISSGGYRRARSCNLAVEVKRTRRRDNRWRLGRQVREGRAQSCGARVRNCIAEQSPGRVSFQEFI